MEKLLIGDVIYRLRKEKGITQEQLTNFTGVSAVAVSKWESGISYPDITLVYYRGYFCMNPVRIISTHNFNRLINIF